MIQVAIVGHVSILISGTINKRQKKMDQTNGMIVSVLSQVDRLSQHFLLGGYQRLANDAAPAIYALMLLGLILYGYSVATGWLEFSLAEFSKRAFTVGLVLLFSLHWGMFSSYVYDLFTQVPNDIASHLIQSLPASSDATASGIHSALQQAWYDGMDIVVALWDRGTLYHPTPFLLGAMIWCLVLIMVGMAVLELIVAKFGLAIFLVLAPVMIPTYLFRPTKEMLFDGWLRNLIGLSLIPIFITSALTLGLILFASVTADIQHAIQQDTLAITQIAPYAIYTVVCIGLLMQATQMASSIAGGFSTSFIPPFRQGAIRSMSKAQDIVGQARSYFRKRDYSTRQSSSEAVNP